MITDKDSMELSDYCFNVCEALNTAIRAKKKGGLNESARVSLEDLARCVDRPHNVGPVYAPTYLIPASSASSSRRSRRGQTYFGNTTRVRSSGTR